MLAAGGVVGLSEAERAAVPGAERPRAAGVVHAAGPPTRLAPLPPAVAGSGGYAFAAVQPYGTTRPVAFDPCRPVRWAVRRDGELPGGDALLEEAVDEVAAATGLVFERLPDTDEPPSADRALVQPDRYGPGIVPVLVAWTDEDEWPALRGLVAGIAGGQWLDGGGVDSRRYVTGHLLLDAEQLAETLAGPDGRARVRAVLLHELAHVVGLGHVDDPDALLAPLHSDQPGYGPGDLRGLRAVGAGECFDDWDVVEGRREG
ncbi:MAG TPA: matrixin family metalloprotease [Mycobacteriales bacterium]|nr:matrixin family metalloprotease [Mycobacteriales bacterium]